MLKLVANYSERIDKYIANNSDISRNDIQKLIELGLVFVNGTKINKNKYILKENDEIEIIKALDKQINVKEQNIKLDVV